MRNGHLQRQKRTHAFAGHSSAVHQLAFSKDGSFFISLLYTPLNDRICALYLPNFFSNASEISPKVALSLAASTAKSYSIAFKTGSDVTTQQMIYEQGGGGTGINLYIDDGLLIANLLK